MMHGAANSTPNPIFVIENTKILKQWVKVEGTVTFVLKMNGCYSVDHCLHIVLSSDNMYDTVEKLLV
jgi:hypothetical protein